MIYQLFQKFGQMEEFWLDKMKIFGSFNGMAKSASLEKAIAPISRDLGVTISKSIPSRDFTISGVKSSSFNFWESAISSPLIS